jgi:Holliday junction resolvase RusA-like endonuclease
MTEILDVFIPGEVRGQGSLTLWRAPDGTERAKHPPKTVAWRGDVAYRLHRQWGDRDPIGRAVAVYLDASFARPKGHYGSGRNAGMLKPSAPRFMGVYPDVDKIARLHLDALTIAGVIVDDKFVVGLTAKKHWTDGGDRPGIRVRVEDLS